MDTPPGGAPCVCRWRQRAPDARGWWVHDCAQPYIQGHLTPVPAILREVGIPSMPRCPWLEIPIPSRPGPSIQRLRPTNSIGSAPGGLYIRTGVCGLRTPDRILSIISSTGSCQVRCVSLDVATILRIVTQHDREGLEAWAYARHERAILTREDEKDQKGLVLAYDSDTLSDPGAYLLL